MAATVRVGTLEDLRASTRHTLVLQHGETERKLLLFSMPGVQGKPTFSCMESECPHLGKSLVTAPLQWHGTDIEDLVIVCPWHQYDFRLSTGDSSTGLRACVYTVRVDDDTVYVEPPTQDTTAEGESVWTCAAVVPVPTQFAAMPPPPPESTSLKQLGYAGVFDPDGVPPPAHEPRVHTCHAVLCPPRSASIAAPAVSSSHLPASDG